MKYERLTNGEFDGQCDHWTSLAFMGGKIGCWNEAEERYMLCEECIHKQRYDRLRKLEDKIENGTLVELPCKIGAKIYIVGESDFCIPKYQMWEDEFCLEDIERFGDTVFLNKAEAEKRLEELRGER